MEKDARSDDEDDEMIHCAHASAYHWTRVGTAVNRARGEWQCSRVYALLGRGEPALTHARRCLELVEANPDETEPWDLPAAYEALARAHSVEGNAGEASRYVGLGREALAAVEDEEDRAHIAADLDSVQT